MKRSSKAIIEDVITVQSNKIHPIIVNFEHGELKDEEVGKISCNLFHDKKEDKTVLALSNGRMVYKGHKPDPNKQLTRRMLMIHNKRTGKVRLIEAEQWQVSPVLEKPNIEENNSDENDKIAILNKQFGSKKTKRRTEQYERMKLDVDSVKEQLENTVANVQIDKSDLSTQLSNNENIINTYLPICNRDATNVKDVYNIYEIIPKSKLETLFNHAMEILNGTVEGKSKFFMSTLKTIQTDPDNVNKVALLLYIDTINTWFSMPMKDAKKRDVVLCPISEEVNTHVINTYSISSANGRLRPNTMKDKGLIHSLILALTISNFVLDLELFRVMLGNQNNSRSNTSLKKLTDLARIIGAVPDKNDKKTVVLKIPLPPQISLVKKGKTISRSNKSN